jgi:hypothetical protein
MCSPSHAIYGGVETILGQLCGGLPKHGWEVILGLGQGYRFNDLTDIAMCTRT